MSELPAGRYRATIVTRDTIEAGGYDMMKLGVIASEKWEALVGAWVPIPDAILVEATWFLRGTKGLETKVLVAFADATGWDRTPEQFHDSAWIPKPVQVVITTKPNKKGDGVYYNIQAMSLFEAEKCESKGGGSSPSILNRAVAEWTGKIPPQPPVVPVPKTEPTGPTAPGVGGEPVPF